MPTLGIYEVFLEQSGRKIWVKPEQRAELYIPCYTPRRLKGGERSVVSDQRERRVPNPAVYYQNSYVSPIPKTTTFASNALAFCLNSVKLAFRLCIGISTLGLIVLVA